ncbi:MAG: hypothetical protein C6H99_03620 [Epsilonproteobacteria bacterium]|nr:hypothetical protein [Campylobacterota bacterium]NPA64562.1 hypothetical protein [Campylobacterota bacterium]
MEILQILDAIKLPIEIPLLKHPVAVHFAIVLPIVALLLEIVNLFVKRRCVGVISSLLLLLATVAYLAAFFTGKVDGKEAYAMLSAAGKEELKEHKELGIYLVYAIGAIFLLKLIVAGFKSGLAKLFFTLVLATFVGFAIKQGKDGGELVYEYGANVKAVSELDDKIMELEEQLEECQGKATTPAATKSQQTPAVSSPASQSEEESQKSQNKSPQEEPAPKAQEAPATTPASESKETSNEAEASSETTIEQKAKAALEEIKGEASSTAKEATSTLEESVEEAGEAASTNHDIQINTEEQTAH